MWWAGRTWGKDRPAEGHPRLSYQLAAALIADHPTPSHRTMRTKTTGEKRKPSCDWLMSAYRRPRLPGCIGAKVTCGLGERSELSPSWCRALARYLDAALASLIAKSVRADRSDADGHGFGLAPSPTGDAIDCSANDQQTRRRKHRDRVP